MDVYYFNDILQVKHSCMHGIQYIHSSHHDQVKCLRFRSSAQGNADVYSRGVVNISILVRHFAAKPRLIQGVSGHAHPKLFYFQRLKIAFPAICGKHFANFSPLNYYLSKVNARDFEATLLSCPLPQTKHRIWNIQRAPEKLLYKYWSDKYLTSRTANHVPVFL